MEEGGRHENRSRRREERMGEWEGEAVMLI